MQHIQNPEYVTPHSHCGRPRGIGYQEAQKNARMKPDKFVVCLLCERSHINRKREDYRKVRYDRALNDERHARKLQYKRAERWKKIAIDRRRIIDQKCKKLKGMVRDAIDKIMRDL